MRLTAVAVVVAVAVIRSITKNIFIYVCIHIYMYIYIDFGEWREQLIKKRFFSTEKKSRNSGNYFYNQILLNIHVN